MDVIAKLLLSSEKLLSHLLTIPEDNARDAYIQEIEALLASRDLDIQRLQSIADENLKNHKDARTLIELDQAINRRLETIMNIIKKDLRDFQQKRKNEANYSNPYGATKTVDGMYYDKKK